jgi:biopolymer transport protein ExbD
MTAPVRAARHHQPAAEPNVIPFIDVLLVLLIIFMVTAPRPTVDLQLELTRRGPPAQVVIPPTIVELHEEASGYRLTVANRDVSLDALGQAVL